MRTLFTLTRSISFALPFALAVACHHGSDDSSSGEGGPASGPGPSLAFLNGFEGEIDLTVTDHKPGDAPLPLRVFVKSNKVRVDLPEKWTQKMGPLGPKAYVILDSPGKKIHIVSDEQKQAIVIDLSRSGEELKGIKGVGGTPSPGGGAPQGPPTKLTKTGKYDTVAGYRCENWDVTSDHREATICVAQEGISWFSIPMTGIPTERLWMAELLDGKHFPLRLVGYAADGATEETRAEVTKIDKTAPPATAFEYPATYRVVDLARLFQGLAGMPGGMPGAMPSNLPAGPLFPARRKP